MEEIKESFNISEYSVSQTSLEQIFNIFAREDVLRKKLASGEALLDHRHHLLRMHVLHARKLITPEEAVYDLVRMFGGQVCRD